MKIMMLADSGSTHTQRWVKSLSERGCNILLFSLGDKSKDLFSKMTNVVIETCSVQEDGNVSFWTKFNYLSAIRKVNKLIRIFKPDIIHAHYASSYGLLGAVARRSCPYIISLWGSDVYEFPEQNILCRQILRYNLEKADYIFSTSKVMANQAKKYTDKSMLITPFGVDTSHFIPSHIGKKDERFVVGTVKSLYPQYGIDVLIRAFKIVLEKNADVDLLLEIYGKGAYLHEYETLSRDLGIDGYVTFHGFVNNTQLPEVYNSFSVSVSLSERESFGVVAVEAMSCACPVITSDADGFTEVVEDGVTGFIVPKRDPESAANAIQRFIDDPMLRSKMGQRGRERVKHLYEWQNNVDTVYEFYKKILGK